MKDARPLHERLRGLDADERCAVEVLASVGIGDADCPCPCSECITKAYEAIADEIERDYIAKSDHEKALNAMVEAQSGVNEPGYRSAHYVMETYAKSKGMPFEDGDCITDWLGRWFIRRPRFEDGEPVKLGDDTDKLHGVEKFIFTRSGGVSCQMQDADGVMHNVFPGELVKRPAPKVLDADGVSICKGDTVWDKETGERLTVVSPCSYTKDGTVVTCKDGGPGELHYAPECLTHREPDSLEKLRDDMKLTLDSMNLPSAPYGEAYNRLTALIERGA